MGEKLKNREEDKDWIHIPEEEIKWEFSHSSGPGGQNVNKRDTKVVIHWHLESSKVLTPEQKEILSSIVDNEGDVVLYSQATRSQWQNREDVLRKLDELVNKTLEKQKERISTKPSYSAEQKRLKEKRIRSQKKQLRKKPVYKDQE